MFLSVLCVGNEEFLSKVSPTLKSLHLHCISARNLSEVPQSQNETIIALVVDLPTVHLFPSLPQIPLCVFDEAASRDPAFKQKLLQVGIRHVTHKKSHLTSFLSSLCVSLGVSPNRVLCLSSPHTSSVVSQVCQNLNCELVKVWSRSEAFEALQQEGGNWLAVVCALGVDHSTYIFQSGQSSLIDFVKSNYPSTSVIVYSHTACRKQQIYDTCERAGAHAVLNSKRNLFKALSQAVGSHNKEKPHFMLQQQQLPPAEEQKKEEKPEQQGMKKEEEKEEEDPDVLVIGEKLAAMEILENMWLVQRLHERTQILSQQRNEHGFAFVKDLNEQLQEQLDSLPRPLLLDSSVEKVRFVSISDTHNHHRRMVLPPGDVLIHTGDLVANYSKNSDIQAHFADVVDWFCELSSSYQLILIVAGNHDTLLDWENYSDEARATLKRLPKNCKILSGSSCHFRGLHIWGSPLLTSRKETMNKRYRSNAFERPRKVREKAFSKIPEKLDVLLTHTPSFGYAGDVCLRGKIEELKYPPKFHCFGHHHSLKASSDGQTIYLNGAQDIVLKRDREGGGAPWVFDIPVPSEQKKKKFVF